MCVCVYLGHVHAYIRFCVLPSQASCAGEYSSPSLQSLLSCGAKVSWGVGGGVTCQGDPSELPLPEEGDQVSQSPLSLAYH